VTREIRFGVVSESVLDGPAWAQIREDLQARRERFGLSYLITPDHELPTLAAIIAGS
jgi:hypothetical protein